MKMALDRIFVVAAVACMLASPSFARPAAMGIETIRNCDGSSISVRYSGDEHYHYAETSDGILVMYNDEGCLVYVDEQGNPTKTLAKDPEARTAGDSSLLKGLSQESARKNHERRRGGRFPKDTSLTEKTSYTHTPVMAGGQKGVSALLKRPTPQKWGRGERWFPVLLVGTTDKAHGDSAKFYDFLNTPGYSENKNIGSLRDYFLFVSDSLFDPHFDVYPIDINASLTSFGRDSSFKEGELLKAGLNELGKRSDFNENAAKYAYDGVNIDGFFFLFPGMEEDALKQSDFFWGHEFRMSANGSSSGWMRSAYKVGKYYFEEYVFIAQYADGSNNSKINKMGIFAHEFSHVLGLQDHYGKDENKKQVDGPGAFDLMSLGMYNGSSTNAGDAPMGYSAFEKDWVGWLKLEELETEKTYSLKKLSRMQAYSISNPLQTDEFYVVEYRPAEKYDAYVRPTSWGQRVNGVYVWYIDYDRETFVVYNNANGDRSHQRVAVNAVLAAGGYYADFTYVNRGGSASIPGIYNIVFDGENRACFTTSQSIPLTECPVDSSEIEVSSSSEFSSSSEVSSSSEAESSDSEGGSEWMLDGRVVADLVHVQLEGRSLHVLADVLGKKNLSLLDLQGRVLLRSDFSESDVVFELKTLPRGNYIVLVNVSGQMSKKVISIRE